MSEENIAVVERVSRAFRERDEEVLFANYAPDIDSTEALEPVAGGDRVVITLRDRAVGTRSRAPIEREHCEVWTFRDGLVARIRVMDCRAEALRAAGLSE